MEFILFHPPFLLFFLPSFRPPISHMFRRTPADAGLSLEVSGACATISFHFIAAWCPTRDPVNRWIMS